MAEQVLNLSKAYVDHLACYALLALALSVGVRVVLALLKCYELVAAHRPTKFWSSFGRVVAGLPPKDLTSGEGKGDYLTSLLVGFLEFLVYPVLMAAGFWPYIGAWIGFKTVAQYKHWGDSRSMFNRFLAGNALVLLLAFTLLVPYIRFRP